MNLPSDVVEFMTTIEESGYQCYLVGGAVRDFLSDKKPKDYDFTTNATPEQVEEIFEKTIRTGIEFGTITVIFKGKPYEITTFRLEHRYSDGRRPDRVFYSDSLKEDLSRRDFTINAIALDKDQNVHDFFNGQIDLQNKVVRAIGRAKVRFKEDKLRKMRAVRIACENGYDIDQDIKSAIKVDPSLEGVSMERISIELIRIIQSHQYARGVRLLFTYDLLMEIFPCLYEIILNMENKKKYYDTLKPAQRDLYLRFYLMLKPLNNTEAIEKALRRLKVKKKIIRYVTMMSEYDRIEDIESLIALVTKAKEEDLEKMLLLDEYKRKNDECTGFVKDCREGKRPMKVTDLEINGKIAQEMGLQREEIGRAFEQLLKRTMKNPQQNNEEDLRKMLEEMTRNS